MVDDRVDAIDPPGRGEAWRQGRGALAVAGCCSLATSSRSTENEIRVVGADYESKCVGTKYWFNGTERFQDKLEIT